MIRKQKSKILVFLLMLGLLYGCKRHLLDPQNPQTQLPPKAQFDKVKGFYEKGRYKNQPRRTSGNERMTAQDSARFKDFEPQWDKTEVELLPNNQKMLIVPVVRFLKVDYNQEIGFIRRLCIRIDENEDFIEANIVELVGNLTFVKGNYNTIFANYKNTSITGFSGVVVIYEIAYDLVVAKEYDQGNFSKNAPIKVDSKLTNWVKCFSWGTVWIEYPCNNHPNNDGGMCGQLGGYWQEMFVESLCYSPSNPFPPTGGTSGGQTTYGGGGNTLPDATDPYCKGKTCPKDYGFSWDDEIFIAPTPAELAMLKSLDSLSAGLTTTNKTGEMDTESRVILAKTLNKLRKSSFFYEKMYQGLRAGAALNPNDEEWRGMYFKMKPNMSARGDFEHYNGAGMGILGIRNTEYLSNEATVAEEFLHAYQRFVAYKNDPNNANLNEVNLEFEVKFMIHVIRVRSNGTTPKANSLYENFGNNQHVVLPIKFEEALEEWIRTSLTPFPTSFSPAQQIDYFYYMDKFKAKQQNTYNFTAPRSNELPKAAFLLFN